MMARQAVTCKVIQSAIAGYGVDAAQTIAENGGSDDASEGARSDDLSGQGADPNRGGDGDGTEGASAATVQEELNSLPDSSGRNVSSVGSEAEMQGVFGRMTRGGRVDSSSSYPGKSVVLRDGTRVGMRPTSQSGGATIDIRFPNGATAKIHIPGG